MKDGILIIGGEQREEMLLDIELCGLKYDCVFLLDSLASCEQRMVRMECTNNLMFPRYLDEDEEDSNVEDSREVKLKIGKSYHKFVSSKINKRMRRR